MKEEQFINQLPQPTKSLFDLLPSYIPDKRNLRQQFVDEVYERTGKKWSKRQLAIMINFMCPKDGGDRWVYDYQKSCREAEEYGKAFWGIYNKEKKNRKKQPS